MKAGMSDHNKRDALRVPVKCKVKIRPLDYGSAYYGNCTDLSVTGLTVETSYVPRPDEQFDLFVMPPSDGTGPRVPLAVRVKVVRCHQMERGQMYELGLLILKVIR
ncbi:PilZ domain-containing protein [Iodobacter ciconiae]|uniref:PilZ domain-containing protein n=1 Tax=Iodobacter ciconiae TaxID=2496266 RepID=A0A3S8ZN75_9NEIS|nr:PilZ domain-containing protein [Iodobacter ciconiae]AZN35033.1 PilZ domain-containing protein [Iodobacter ciconiae]